MGMKVHSADETSIKVTVPITRPDVLHPCDIAEDLAIAYGYEKLERRLPPNPSVGKQTYLNFYTDMLKQEVLGLGFTEIITFGLTQIDEQSKNLGRSGEKLAIVSNPKSIDCECARKSLIPGVLKTLHSNKGAHLPINIFEMGDIVLLEDGVARN